MGVFSHEAIASDPDTGIVYLTKDGETDVDVSDASKDTGGFFLLRFIPTDRSRKPGALQAGGTLEALQVVEAPTANDADLFDPGPGFGSRWVVIDPEGPTEDAAAKECVTFNRLEGAHFDGGALWFCDAGGGENQLGQIFRYIPSTNTLELFYEGDDAYGIPSDADDGVDVANLESPDNITIAPWGDVIIAEDGGGVNRLIGFTPRVTTTSSPFETSPTPTSRRRNCRRTSAPRWLARPGSQAPHEPRRPAGRPRAFRHPRPARGGGPSPPQRARGHRLPPPRRPRALNELQAALPVNGRSASPRRPALRLGQILSFSAAIRVPSTRFLIFWKATSRA